MTRDQLRTLLLQELAQLAPEADLAMLEPTTPLREELDLDSFDFIRFITAVDERLSIEVSESDYTHFETLGSCLDYLEARLQAR